MKKFLAPILVILSLVFSVSSFSQTTNYQPKDSKETFLHIESEKDGKKNAAILCLKQEESCIQNNQKISIMQFVRNNGYKGFYERSTKILNGAEYYILFVWK